MSNIYPLQVIQLAKMYGMRLEEVMHWYNFYNRNLEILKEILPFQNIGRRPTIEELLDCLNLTQEQREEYKKQLLS